MRRERAVAATNNQNLHTLEVADITSVSESFRKIK
jgi:hypothetical protein